MKLKTTLLFLFCAFLSFSQIMVSTVSEPFNGSGGVKIGPDGYLYIGNFGAELGNANGTEVWKLDENFNFSLFASGMSGASGNDFDSQGNFYQSNIAGNRISKITPDGTVSNFVNLGQGAAPVGIAIDDEDNLFICQCGNNIIRKISPAGVASNFASGGIFNCPNGAIFDHEGNLYISNFSNSWVVKITPSGQASNFAFIQGNNNGHLTFCPVDTVLYVNSHGSSRIYKVTLDGEVTPLVGSGVRGNADGSAALATLSRPNGIVATASGDTLFLNSSIPTIDNPPANFFPLNPSLLRMVTGLQNNPVPSLEPWQYEGLELNHSPNPASDFVRIEYFLPIAATIKLQVFDINGRLLKTLENDFKMEGKHELIWQLEKLNPGLYEYVLSSKEFQIARRIVIN